MRQPPKPPTGADDVTDEFGTSEDKVLKQEDDSFDDAHESDTIKYCIKGEPVSCYCSASHTDNISTDEHDSLRDSHASSHHQTVSRSLHLSDSGADLTADVSCSDSAWQKYWATNGERLIWESWITKYSAYINPEYLQTNQIQSEENYLTEELPNPDKVEGTSSLKVSFESISPQQDDCPLGLNIGLLQVKENPNSKPVTEIIEKNRMLIRNLSYSDSYEKLNREIEGWNPLSPVSNDCETEAERLLSSRCASRTGSSARTIDSMTNVTRLTVSSIDLSESSKNSDSFSSVSSIQSSITSTSSEDIDEPTDHEQQWNVLWTKHYEEEYLEHYKKFLCERTDKTTANTEEAAGSTINDCKIDVSFKTSKTPKPTTDFDEQTSESSYNATVPETPKIRKRKIKQKEVLEKTAHSVGYLLRNLKKIEEIDRDTGHNCECDTNSSESGNIVEDQALKMDKVDGNSKCDTEIDLSINSPTLAAKNITLTKEKSKSLETGFQLDIPKAKTAHHRNSIKNEAKKHEKSLDTEVIDDNNDNYKFGMEIDLSPNCFNKTDSASKVTKPQESVNEDQNCKEIPSEIKNVEAEIGDIPKSETIITSHSNFGNQTENLLNTNVEVKYIPPVCEEAAMTAMGIPLSFGCQKPSSSKKKPNIQCARKRSFEEDVLDQSSSNRIKAAFTLLGIEMHESQEQQFRGAIDYKMKHIRSQNRRLQFRNEDRKKNSAQKHIHFDDDGEVITDISGSNEVTVQNSHQDELLGMIPSSSTENELELTPDQGQHQDAEKCGESIGKKRKRKRKMNIPVEIRENPKLKKFWHRRYSLFNKFDLGIKLDEESWFSVTPELVAQHTAERCQCDVIIDAFCGAGGNSIQFALTCKKVIAVDIDSKKIELAQHNAQVYGVADRIEFIIGDFFQLASSLQGDVVFLSPPWGGPEYKNLCSYDLELLQPVPFSELLSTAKQISENVALFLPKNSNTYPLITASGPGGKVEIEQNFLGKRLIALTAYYGKLVKDVSSQKKVEGN